MKKPMFKHPPTRRSNASIKPADGSPQVTAPGLMVRKGVAEPGTSRNVARHVLLPRDNGKKKWVMYYRAWSMSQCFTSPKTIGDII